MVELLTSTPVHVDLASIAKRASERTAMRVEVAHAMALGFPDLRVKFDDTEVPYTVTFLPAGNRAQQPGAWIDSALQQTWGWDRELARTAAASATDALLVTDIMSGLLDRRLRLPAFHAALAAAVELLRPAALHWAQGERFVEPSAYLADVAADTIAFQSTVNVRYVTISDRPGEQLMDTVGLAPFLIPDIQMHFTTLDPGLVAGKLLRIARYLFEQGDVIEDGQTVPGFAEGERWPCRHEEPLLGPPRVVLDVDPWPNGPRRN
jgi:hypothetical protein